MSVAYRRPESDPVAEADLTAHIALKRGVHGFPSSVGSGEGLVGDGSGGWSAVAVEQTASKGAASGYAALDSGGIVTDANAGIVVRKPWLWDQLWKGVTYTNAIVGLRFDDGYAADFSTIYPLLTARDLVAMFALNNTLGTGGKMTLANALTMQGNGMQLAHHSRTHGSDPATVAAFIDEVGTAANEYRAQNLLLDAFVQPGTWTGTYSFASPAKFDTPIGRWFVGQYGSIEAYLPEVSTGFAPLLAGGSDTVGVKPLPALTKYGANHSAGSQMSLANAKKLVDLAIAMGGYVEFLWHANELDTANRMTTADLTAFLDYVQAKRDAGLIDCLTPTGALYAEKSATKRNLLGDADFELCTAPSTFSLPWTVSGSPTIIATGGSDGNVLGVTTNNWVQQNLPSSLTRSVRFEGWARTATPGTTATARSILRFRDAGTNYVDKQVTKTVGDTWTLVTNTAGNDPRAGYATSLGLECWLYQSGATGVQWRDAALYKI